MMPAIFPGMLGEMIAETAQAVGVAGQFGEVVAGQQTTEHVVHAGVRVAHRHRTGGVAVIAAVERDELPCAMAGRG